MKRKKEQNEETEQSFIDNVFAKYPAMYHVTFQQLREVMETLKAGPDVEEVEEEEPVE